MNTGRYQVLRPIAKGGMAEVFLARITGEAGFEKQVALKRIPAGWASDDDVVKMLMDEARLAARLNHPNIVQVFDFGRDEQGYYIAMEYVPGPDLNTVLKYLRGQGERPPEALLLPVVIQALRGLDYAHRAKDESGRPLGVVHRDVSPSNILLTPEGAAKVSDFGIAKAAGRLTVTQAGSLKGKIPYMSPEQARGKPVDARSDVLSAGLILWECVVGRRCYNADADMEILRQAAHAEHATFSELGLEVSPALESIVEKALARNPEDRFPSAGELANALEAYHRQAHPTFNAERLGALVRDAMATNVTPSGFYQVPPGLPGSGGHLAMTPAPPQAQPVPENLANEPTSPSSHATDAAVEVTANKPVGAPSLEAAERLGKHPTFRATASGKHLVPDFPQAEPAGPDTLDGGAGGPTLEEPADLPPEPEPKQAKPRPAPMRRPKMEADDEPKPAPPPPKPAPAPAPPPPAKKEEGGGLGTIFGLLALVMLIGGGTYVGMSYYDSKQATRIVPPPAKPPEETSTAKPDPAAPPAKPHEPHEDKPERPEKAAHKARADGPPGFLAVSCKPACFIYVDDTGPLNSPLGKTEFPSGDHVLRIHNPQFHYDKKHSVAIKPGELTSKHFDILK